MRISGAAGLESPTLRPGWIVVIASFFGVMVGFGSLVVYTFGVFLKPLSAEFHWSREAISRGFAFAALSVAVASPKLGQVLDRAGARRIMAPVFAIMGLGLVSLALLTPHLLHFYAVFIILGLVGNATSQMGFSRPVCTWFSRRRGMALALVIAGSSAGSMALPALAQKLIDTYGWRMAYAGLGLLVFGIGLPVTLAFVRERPGYVSHAPGVGSHRDIRGQALRSRVFWIIIVTLFFGSISVNGAITHLAALLTDRGISPRIAAQTLSVLGAASLIGRIGTGWLLDRFFGPRVCFGLVLFMSAGIALLAGARSAHAGMLAAALIGIGIGGESDVTPYLLTRYFGLSAFSTLYGLTWSAYAAAGAIGPVVMGRAFDLTGSYVSFLAIIAAGTLLSGSLMLAMPGYEALRAGGADEICPNTTVPVTD
ncbi:MAG: MFS transporter [Bryobacteraceae bacterium]